MFIKIHRVWHFKNAEKQQNRKLPLHNWTSFWEFIPGYCDVTNSINPCVYCTPFQCCSINTTVLQIWPIIVVSHEIRQSQESPAKHHQTDWQFPDVCTKANNTDWQTLFYRRTHSETDWNMWTTDKTDHHDTGCCILIFCTCEKSEPWVTLNMHASW